MMPTLPQALGPAASVSGSPGQIGAAAPVASAVRGPARGRLTIGAAARFCPVCCARARLPLCSACGTGRSWKLGSSRRCCPARRPGPNHGWRCQARRCQAWLARCVPSTASTRCPTTQKSLQPTLVRMLRVHAAQRVGVCEVGQAVMYWAAALPAGPWPWWRYGATPLVVGLRVASNGHGAAAGCTVASSAFSIDYFRQLKLRRTHAASRAD